ncbi:MAG: HAD-IIB family hydrolase, partial [Verrucomicrobia bacterium]|nr:HAD-IIB family hydrolase [Verrucomicrobiota bacterium]
MKPTSTSILLCMDMDRTVLPNGQQAESPQARDVLRRLARRPELIISYVSGRRKELQMEAIREFDLPEPAYSVADVGTSIYEVVEGDWTLLKAWHAEISRSWRGRTSRDLGALLDDVEELRLQEPEAQGKFKLSYFAKADLDHEALVQRIERRLESDGCRASVIWSVDETTNTGLVDILPERADKRHAVEFLMQHTGVKPERMVYAGDSGNDLPVL